MVWARRLLASVLTLVLFVSLVGAAISTSANSAFAHPQKIETWLNQSNLYQSFLAEAVSQAQKAAGATESQGSVTLSDTAVQQAAGSSFSTAVFQQSLNTFLDSNYAWLEGKAATPAFAIDLSKYKQGFADQIGQYVQDHIASLPACTAQQLAEIGSVNNIDPLNITCRPPTLDPKAEADLVAQKVNSSGGFLSNPVITANNLNPNGGGHAEPYYQKFSSAPTLYQAAVKLPWIYAAAAVISALGVVFLPLRKRSGLRTVAGTLLSAGAVLLVLRFLADTIVTQIEKHVFNQSTVGQLQQSLTHFASLVEQQMVNVDLWFAIGYIALAVIIFVVLLSTRNRQKTAKKSAQPASPPDEAEPIAQRLRTDGHRPAAEPPADDRPTPTGPPPPPKRPPRLIQ